MFLRRQRVWQDTRCQLHNRYESSFHLSFSFCYSLIFINPFLPKGKLYCSGLLQYMIFGLVFFKFGLNCTQESTSIKANPMSRTGWEVLISRMMPLRPNFIDTLNGATFYQEPICCFKARVTICSLFCQLFQHTVPIDLLAREVLLLHID